MLILLESEDEIASAQAALERALRSSLRQKAIKDIGYPGGRARDATVWTDGRHWFRSEDLKGRNVKNPRRLNWFGQFKESKGVAITVEVNTSYSGRNDRAAGFFARDSRSGDIYLIHSGRVGGGKKGVGKNAFRAWSQKPLVEVAASRGQPRRGIIVAPIQGVETGRLAARYIDLVSRFKLAVRSGEVAERAFQRKEKEFVDFYSESRGRRTGERTSMIDYISRHGEIVDALHAWRKAQPLPKNARLVKSIFIDMGVAIGRDLVELFEIKPSSARTSIYSGLGQLIVHAGTKNCRLALVLPHRAELSKDLKAALARESIRVVRFRLKRKGIEILG